MEDQSRFLEVYGFLHYWARSKAWTSACRYSWLFATLSIYVYIEIRNHYIAIQVSNVLVFAAFFLGVVLCFSFSGLFHMISNYSEEVTAFSNQLHHLGIVILI